MFFILLSLIPAVNAVNDGVVEIEINTSKGTVGFEHNFSILVTALKEGVYTNPVDVVLVIDCSGSMRRYGDIILEPSYVTLTDSYQKVGEFRLNNAGEVEVMLQIPIDIYYSKDKFSAYVKRDGWTSSVKYGYSVVRWDLEGGSYDVYAKKVYSQTNPYRIFAIELPPERISSVKNAAKKFVDLMGENDRIAVVKFHSYGWNYNSHTTIVQPLESDKTAVKNVIESLTASGGTPLGEGIERAIEHLDNHGRSEAEKVIVLLTDGWWNMGDNPIDWANVAANKGYRIYTIGYGGVNEDQLQEISDITGGRYYFAADEDDLLEIYSEIAQEIRVVVSNAVLRMNFSSEFLGASKPYTGNDVYEWQIGELSMNETFNLTVTVKSDEVGEIEVANGSVNYVYNGSSRELEFTVEVNFENREPVFNITDYYEINESEVLSFDVNVYDPDGHAINVTCDTELDGTSFDGTTFTYTPGNITDSYTTVYVNFSASDGYSVVNKTITIKVYDSSEDSAQVIVNISDDSLADIYIGDMLCVALNTSCNCEFCLNVTLKNATNAKVLVDGREVWRNDVNGFVSGIAKIIFNSARDYKIEVVGWRNDEYASDSRTVTVYIKKVS